MILIIDRIKLYSMRQTVTVTGVKYKIGDFVFKIGSIMILNSAKGLIMEIEYLPSVIPNSCSEMFQEFLDQLLGSQEKQTVSSVTYPESMPEVYSYIHTTFQYVNMFKSILSK